MKTSISGYNRTLHGFLLALALAVTVPYAHAQLYTAVNIGSLGGNTIGYALNDSGNVVGSASDAAGNAYAFSYQNGTLTQLPVPLSGYIGAYTINDLNVIGGAGYLNHNSYAQPYESFIDNNGNITLLTEPGGTTTIQGINDSGIAAGGYAVNESNFFYNAFSYSNGTFTPIGPFFSSWVTYGLAINATNTIVGYYSNPGSNQQAHAFSYTNGTITALGSLPGGSYSAAIAINNLGTIAGYSSTANGNDHAFMYSNGIMKDLGTLGGLNSSANGINIGNEIVGESNTTSGAQDAFIDINGNMTDLNSLVSLPGVTLTDAYAINGQGQIATEGSNGQAYLLTPINVPEPSTYAVIFGVAILGLVALKRRI